MEGGVDHLEAVRHLGDGFLVVDHGGDIGHELAVRLLAHRLDEPGADRLVEVHPLHAGEDVNLREALGDGVGVVGGQLGAVLPVDLVAVILLGVVAGGDVQTRLAVVLPHGEAQLRGGAQGLKDPDVDAVGGADLGGGPGKLHGVVAAVHADGDAPALALLALGGDDLRKALGGPADDVEVHVVETGGHDAPEPGGAELQRAVEAALDLVVVAADGLQLGLLLLGEGGACQPFFVFLAVIHQGSSFSAASSTGFISSRASSSREAGT